MNNTKNNLNQVEFIVDENKFPLESDRIMLRKWTMDDASDLFEFRSQAEVMNPVGGVPLKSIEEAKYSLEMIIDWYVSMYKYDLAIYHRKDKKVIGTIGLKFKDISNNIIEIGYLLNKNYWNQGIMTESLRLMINYIRSISSSVKIICMCNIDNGSSRRVVEKCQMKFTQEIESNNDVFAVYES